LLIRKIEIIFSEYIEDEEILENTISGKLEACFRPEDLSKLTSVEVERIFADSVIYDDSKDSINFENFKECLTIFNYGFLDDVVAIFKPYGIPMFGDSKLVTHSVEKYLNAICNATKAEKLFEVLILSFFSKVS
jgi:hypothetical protein